MISFQVWAPNAERVELLTVPDPAGPPVVTPMTGHDDGIWRVDAEAPAGTEYLFRLHRDGAAWERKDPRARQVTNSVGRSVVTEPGHPPRDFTPRPLDEWVIYELHPRTFGGTLDGVAERLDHLVGLGVTAVELMPIAEFAGDISWGYNTAFPFAVESSYGGPDALRRLVDACHRHGIAVIVDVVYNHLGPSDLDLWRFDGWSEGDGGGVYFFNDWRAATPWGATRPDYGRPEVRQFLIDNARMWLDEYAVDGLRLDATNYIRNADGHNGPDRDIPDGWAFLQELTSTIAAEFPGAVLIAEDLQNQSLVTTPVADGGLGFHLQWAAGFVHPIRASLTAIDDLSRNLDGVAAAVTDPGGPHHVLFTESHDEVANGQTRVPAEIDPGDPEASHAVRRAALGAVLTMTSPGVPMLFQGQEWADEDWFDDNTDLQWERAEQRHGIVQMWRDLIRLRVGDDPRTRALRNGRVSVEHPADGVLAVRRWTDSAEDDTVLIALNISAVDVDHVDLGLDPAQSWECVFSSDWSGYHDSGGNTSLEVANGGCALPCYAAAIIVPSGV